MLSLHIILASVYEDSVNHVENNHGKINGGFEAGPFPK